MGLEASFGREPAVSLDNVPPALKTTVLFLWTGVWGSADPEEMGRFRWAGTDSPGERSHPGDEVRTPDTCGRLLSAYYMPAPC